jgi:hypothetical protein
MTESGPTKLPDDVTTVAPPIGAKAKTTPTTTANQADQLPLPVRIISPFRSVPAGRICKSATHAADQRIIYEVFATLASAKSQIANPTANFFRAIACQRSLMQASPDVRNKHSLIGKVREEIRARPGLQSSFCRKHNPAVRKV